MTSVARVLFALFLTAGTATASTAVDDRARVETWMQEGAFARADSLAKALLAAAPDSSEAQVDALLLVVRAARRSGSIPLRRLVTTAEDLIALQTALLPADDPRIAEAWHELANTHVRRGKQADAALAFHEAFTRRRATLGDDATPTIRSALGLANALQWTGRRDEARTIFREQIGRLEGNPTGREDRLVFALNGLGFLQRRSGDRESAIDAFRRAVEIASTTMPAVHLTRALVERNLGITLAVDAPELAVDHLHRAYAIRRELLPARDVLVGKVALALADVEARLGRAQEADAHYAVALEILGPRTSENTAVRDAWIGRANVGIEIGDFDGANAAIDSAAARDADPTTVLTLRANRANEMGDFEVAVRLYDDALRRREATSGRESPEFARVLHNRAEVLARQGRNAAALESRREAVRIQEETLAVEDLDLALGRVNLAVLLLDLDEVDGARRLLDATRSTLLDTLDENHPMRANFLLLSARAGAARAESDTAVSLAAKAVRIRRLAYGPDHIEVAWALEERAGFELAAGAFDSAAVTAAHADRIARAQLRDIVLTLPERQALAFVGAGRSGRDLLIEIARRDGTPERVREAFDATIRSRALVLDAMLERRRASTSSDTAVVAARTALDRARRDLVAAVTRGPADAERWQRLRTRRERAEAQLAAVSDDDRLRLEREDRGLGHVLGALSPGEALVSFAVLGDFDRVVSFVARNDQVDLIDLGNLSTLDDDVAHWLSAVRAPILRHTEDPAALADEAREAARRLGERILDPLDDALVGITRVWWVPDGALQRVQPAALLDRSGRYLATRDLVIAQLGAERDLEVEGPPSRGARILAVGDPDFGTAAGPTPPCPELSTLTFAPLPATRAEVDAIPATTRVFGAEAREQDLPSWFEGHDMLHLATHGFYLPPQCAVGEASAMRGLRGIGGVVQRGRRRAATTSAVGPLLRSGLVLAGANVRATVDDPSHDGLLLAEEIAGMDLGGIETVVLSACDTGVGGIIEGEGVLGLPRAFRQAGARQVVMSLWPVQDDATRAWMAAFYASCTEGKGVAAAAQDARSAVLDAEPGAHPFFWAAFVAIGPER